MLGLHVEVNGLPDYMHNSTTDILPGIRIVIIIMIIIRHVMTSIRVPLMRHP